MHSTDTAARPSIMTQCPVALSIIISGAILAEAIAFPLIASLTTWSAHRLGHATTLAAAEQPAHCS